MTTLRLVYSILVALLGCVLLGFALFAKPIPPWFKTAANGYVLLVASAVILTRL